MALPPQPSASQVVRSSITGGRYDRADFDSSDWRIPYRQSQWTAALVQISDGDQGLSACLQNYMRGLQVCMFSPSVASSFNAGPVVENASMYRGNFHVLEL